MRSVGGGRSFFDAKQEAESFAFDRAAEVKNYGELALTLSQDERIEFLQIKDRLQKMNASMADCLTFYEKHHQAIRVKPIEEVAAEFSRVKRHSGKRHRYVLMLESAARVMQEATGAKFLSDVTIDTIESWFTARNYATSSRKSLMTHLSTFFEFAIKRGYAADNPVKRMECVSLDEKPVGILTVDQSRHLLETCRRIDPALVDFIAVQLFGGLRPVEAQALAAEDFRDGHINVTSTGSKVRTRRLVTINATLKAWLTEPPNIPAVNWRRRLGAVRAAAAIPWPSDCLRHTAASMMLPIYGTKDTATELGHSEAVLLKHYREVVPKKEAETFWAMAPANNKSLEPPARTPAVHSLDTGK